METRYLSEAFKELRVLNEEDFPLTAADGIQDMKDFVDADKKEDFVEIIDPEAETEEELEDSYIGKVILDCCVCHSKIYKNREDIVISEEDNLANEGEECPFCFSNDGYKIIGQIQPFEEVEKEMEEENEVDEPEETEEDFDESLDDFGILSLFDNKDELPEGIDPKMNKKKDESKELEEGFEKVEIETEDQTLSMDSDPSGEVVVRTAPKTQGLAGDTGNEVIGPIDDITKDEIEADSEEDEVEETEIPNEDEVELDVDEFDEDSFNELGESYLQNVYDNVVSFKTNSVKSLTDNKLVVEGVIKFTSGKKKQTSFIFEAKEVKKNNKLTFSGLNEQICRGKKSFTLNGKLDGNRFISESLNYNYRAKDENGNSRKVYGTVNAKTVKGLAEACKGDECKKEPKEKASCKGASCKKELKEADKPAATSIEDAQKWVDYDMKKYGKISERTNKLVKKAGFQIIKDDHGDYEVAAGKFESLEESFDNELDQYIRDFATGDYEVGKTMDPDDFSEFRHILKDDGFSLSKKDAEKAFERYFELLDELKEDL